jgi:hypothetical protein
MPSASVAAAMLKVLHKCTGGRIWQRTHTHESNSSRAARRKRADDARRAALNELQRDFTITQEFLVAADDLKADARQVVTGPVVPYDQRERGRRVHVSDGDVKVAQCGKKFGRGRRVD